MPVHLFGLPAEMERDRGDRRAPRARGRRGRGAVDRRVLGRGAMTGGVGLVGAFSFYPTKNLNAAGDAGMITTELGRGRPPRAKPAQPRQRASILPRRGGLQLTTRRGSGGGAPGEAPKHIEAYNEGRRRIARRYTELLSRTRMSSRPRSRSRGSHVFHQYTVLSERPSGRDHGGAEGGGFVVGDLLPDSAAPAGILRRHVPGRLAPGHGGDRRGAASRSPCTRSCPGDDVERIAGVVAEVAGPA